MAWIESHTVLSRHRKVKETARALRIRPAYLIGHLHLLWHAALEQAEDGDLTRWSDEFIAESADYPGDAPQFVQLLQDHGWLDGRLLHDWIDCAGRYLIGKYAKDDRDRLVQIWAKYGKVYGKKTPNQSPTESQQNPNQTPRTPLGRVGEVPESSGKGSAEGKPPDAPRLPVRSEEAVALAAARRPKQDQGARAAKVLDEYPTRSKDGRTVRIDLAAHELLSMKIAESPDYPWEEAAKLERLNDTPMDAVRWISSQPDPILLATRRRQAAEAPKQDPAPGRRKVEVR